MTGGWGAGLRLLRPRDAICPTRADADPAGVAGLPGGIPDRHS